MSVKTPGVDKPAGRVIALLVLLLVVAAALRGYLPARHDRTPGESGDSRVALLFMVTALAVALSLVAIAVIARLRDPRATAPRVGDLSEMLGTGRGRPSWRVLLVGLAVLVAWLVIVTLLARHLPGHESLSPPPPPDTAAAARPDAPAASPARQRPHRDNGDMVGVLLVATVAALSMLVTGTVVAGRRRRRPATPDHYADGHVESPSAPTHSGSLARAAERGLAEMTDLSREPREAIIACYVAMERELARVPGAVPQEFDTATEVLDRAVEQHALHSDSALELVTLFTEARFSPHVMNEGHRDVAVQVLHLVLDELRSRSNE